VGDLLMSAIKRTYGIKDYGKLFPGHGGVLDRFDSVMAVALVLLVITAYFGLFTVA
jgi:phosphatidate cytidylyltransferase